MTIKDAMKKFVVGTGGTTSLKSTTDLHDEINQKMGESLNPLMALKVDTDIDADTDLLGKVVGDLQIGIHVYKDSIEGTLYYVEGYTGFSGLAEEQHGHYLAIHVTVPGVTGAVIKVNGVTLDSDGIFVGIIKNKNGVIRVSATKDGATYTREFKLDRLFLSKKSAPTEE